MRKKLITPLLCLVTLLCISSHALAALNAVNIGADGITFPDNSVQAKAAVLPTCSSGGVLVNNSGAWLCGAVMPIVNGVATCANTVCSVSACLSGFDNCDGVVANGCESSLATIQNCGACGVTCAANQICNAGACQLNPNSPLSLSVSASPGAGFINNQRPVTITANVQKVAGGAVPAGTTVNFVVTSGNGTFSAASSITNASGNASVLLNSPVEGNVTVTASASPASGSANIAFSNPNKPAAITLAATPTTGSTNNNGPVSLKATLTPADTLNGTIANGTPVTFTVQSGTGTLSATTATTTNGVATVTLNSTVVGGVTVNATAGSTPLVTSNTVSVPFIIQPTLATVKLATSGTLPGGTLIGGIHAVVSAIPSTGLSLQASDVTATGAGAGSLVSANTTNIASVAVALLNSSGFPAGEVATLNYHIANGAFPVAGNFGITPVSVIDLNGNAIPGVTVSIQGVTIQ